MFGWVSLPSDPARATVGMPVGEEDAVVVDRCEDCGAGLVRDATPVDLGAEFDALVDAEQGALVAANRGSIQSSIGGDGWAALAELPGRMVHTKRSLELIAERQGRAITEPASPPLGRGQRWMWQTLINGLTLQPNFASRARSGALRPATGRGRAAFELDAVVTILAAPLVGLLSLPLELLSSLAGRGGVLEARLEGSDAPQR
jgi:hypothetical protein